MRILVLGGHGFVGKNLVTDLVDAQYDVAASSRVDGLDLTDFELTRKYFKNLEPSVVINLAANVGSLNYVTQFAAEVLDVNMRMLLNVFKAAQEVIPNSVLINPIANCGYPGKMENYVEDEFWEGKIHQSVLAYGSTRRMIDVLSDCYRMQYGLRTINFFVPNMYGPFDSTDPNKAHALNALIGKFVKANIEKSPQVEVWGSGIAIREWLYVKDFARIIAETIKRMNEPGLSEPVNIAQSYGLSVRELVQLITGEVHCHGEVRWNREMPDGAPKKVMSDIKFRKIFPGFQFTPMIEGIRKTIDFYKKIYPY